MLPVSLPTNSKSLLDSLAKLGGWILFQINQKDPYLQGKDAATPESQPFRFNSPGAILEIILVFAVLAVFAFSVVPGVNESHYLTKAKQFWNPNWCTGDLFLESVDAHYFFFLSCGWLTRLTSLEATAWIGRVACWLGFAVAWVGLNRSLSAKFGYSVISAAMFMLLSNQFDMAGEWVVGGFEAKSIAYIFVVYALTCYLDKRNAAVLVSLGLATAFHAVIGGWATICWGIAIFTEALLTRSITHLALAEHSRQTWFLSILTFVVLVAIGCVAPLLSNVGVDATTIQMANAIQVQQRLSHHLLFQNFPALHVARFAFLVAIWLLITRTVFISRKFQRLSWFCSASLFISLVGMLLSGMVEGNFYSNRIANALLRFYWFRFSDFAIPLGLALFSYKLFDSLFHSKMKSQRIAAYFSAALLGLAAIVGVIEANADSRAEADKAVLPSYPGQPVRTQQAYENWRAACYWIENNTRNDSLFVTPMQQQTFKWYAQRAEFVCWKDMPQDAAGIVQWRKRISILRGMQQIVGGALALNDEQIHLLNEDFGVTHLLVAQANEDMIESPASSILTRIYPADDKIRSTYVVYRINEAQLASETESTSQLDPPSLD